MGARHPRNPPPHHLLPHFPSRSRIACYVTIFQNISNLRDVFYKEMSKVGGGRAAKWHPKTPLPSPPCPGTLVTIPGCSGHAGAGSSLLFV